jgi:hypothetical protein
VQESDQFGITRTFPYAATRAKLRDVVVGTAVIFVAMLVRSDDEEGTRWWHDIDDHPRKGAHADVPKAGKPSVPPIPVVAKKHLDAEDIENAAAANKQLTNRCWSMALKHAPNLPLGIHHVSVSLAVETDGHVSHLDIDGIPEDDGGLAGCLATVMMGWHMPVTSTAASYDVTLAFQ